MLPNIRIEWCVCSVGQMVEWAVLYYYKSVSSLTVTAFLGRVESLAGIGSDLHETYQAGDGLQH